MKTIQLLLCFMFFSFLVQSQDEGRTTINLGDRVPEAPLTHPGGIRVKPTKIPKPIPPYPPSITTTAPEASRNHHERKVFFIPGFGGERSKWSRAVEASEDGDGVGFPGRAIEATALDYEQNASLNLAASNVGEDITTITEGQIDSLKPLNFLIGHSQGGLVAKTLVYRDTCLHRNEAQGLYGGIVTVNSSLNGAQILASRDAGLFHQMADKICSRFTNQILTNVPGIILNFVGINENGDINGTKKSICDIFEFNSDFNILDFAFSDLNQPIANDYLPGAVFLNKINACEAPGIAKVAIYGVEPYEPLPGVPLFDNPIFYRTIQHFFSDVNHAGFFGANDDSALAKKAQGFAMKALIRALQDRSMANFWFQVFKSPLTLPWRKIHARKQYRKFKKRADAHFAVYRLYHELNDDWMAIIGATGVDNFVLTSNNHTCECVYEADSDWYTETFGVNSEAECADSLATLCVFYEGIPSSTTVTVEFFEKPSDGVVLAESASYMTGADVGRILESHPNPFLGEINTGSSHMQARNDRNLKYMLLRLYEGELHDFFKTDRI